ncbi:MAG: hypothetical protein KDC34_17015 [Saprospiraceae bacterium]|nr:hypothetical protein [Saprospiraceae bacterium]
MAKKSKLRMTGFARFFFVMIIVVPIAYLGASWYNGEDGLQTIKNWFNTEKPAEQPKEPAQPVQPIEERQAEQPIADQQELLYYKQRVTELEAEADQLKEQVWKLQQELSQLRGE